MRTIIHPELGNLSPERTTVEPFRPERWLCCPGNLKKLRRIARRKYLADVGDDLYRLPKRIRSAAIEQAVDTVICRFLDANYGKAGITDDEPARAVLWACGYCRASRWRTSNDSASRRDSRTGTPYIGSMASRGDNPAAVASAIEQARRGARYATGLQEDLAENRARSALTGEVRERKTGKMIQCPGGKAYGESRKIVATERVSGYFPGSGAQEWEGVGLVPFVYRWREYDGGWQMEERKSHTPTTYDPGTVPETVDVGPEPGTFVPPAPPATGIPPIPGTELTRKPIPERTLQILAAGPQPSRGTSRVILRG